MKTTKNAIKSSFIRRSRRFDMLPSFEHIVELVVAIVIFSAGQNIWGVVVKADGGDTPSVPTGLMVTGQSATEIDLSWTASSGIDGVAGYNIYRNGTEVGSSISTSYANTSLAPDTSYSYTVTAYDSLSDESAQSSPVSSNTLADTSPPTTPTDLHQTGQSITSVSLAWDPSSDNVGVTDYNIFRNGSLIHTQTGTSFTDSGLAVYTNYNYNVTALDAAGNSSNASTTLVADTSKDTEPPSVPDNIREIASTVSTITIEWNASTDNVGVAGYNVYRNGSLLATQGGTSFTDSGLTYNSDYTYTVSAFDAAGNVSAQSAPFSGASSTDTEPPTIPANLQETQIKDDSISLSWNASTDNVEVAGYKIYRDNQLVGTTTGTSFMDTELYPVTTYDYYVEAYDESNNVSAASSTLSVETAYDTTPPTTPTNFISTGQTDTTIALSWNAATDNIAVGGYNIYRNNQLLTSTVGTSFTDSGLSVSTSYTYQVEAVDTSGNLSPLSAPLSISTIADKVPPSVPADLITTAQTTTTVSLQWNTATDDVAVASYNVYRNGSLIANIPGTTYVDSGLYFGTTYHYSVTALDTSGNESAKSTTLDVNTADDTAPPTLGINGPSNGQNLDLTFPISATASDQFGITQVQFYVDTNLINTITSPPYSFNWNSYAVHNTSHTLTVVATNKAGLTTSNSLTFNIDNPPPPIVGDLNGDHKVNILDLSILLSRWGKSGVGDFQNTGHVNIFDLSILLSHYGEDDSNYN